MNSLSSYRNKIIVHNISDQVTTDKIDFMEYKISSTNKIKMKIIDKDIVYIMYTSGTTGTDRK
ncbi:long-chain fatty acid--CoA ligase, partial [Clostridioides difficile]|uniref:long-chain fatty acid--CoA ligase n=1 Tax=Clostridioides difficile TaxID=1496 RepID=UPI001F42C76E